MYELWWWIWLQTRFWIPCWAGFLAITSQLHQVNSDLLGWWLCERQLPSGGLNGRPEKLPDVCYSWWVLASLKIIGRLHWINREKLRSFILACQDEETGGFADRPGSTISPGLSANPPVSSSWHARMKLQSFSLSILWSLSIIFRKANTHHE